MKFLRFFKIDEQALRQAIKNFEYLNVPKNYYVFLQGEQSRKFFGIIKGSVSLRVRKKINFATHFMNAKLKLPVKNKSIIIP